VGAAERVAESVSADTYDKISHGFYPPERRVLTHDSTLSLKETDMEQQSYRTRPYALKAGEGWTYRFDIDFTIKASEVEEGSGVAILEFVTKKGEEPPDHTHMTEDEMFYVLEGALTIRCDSETFDLEKGGFIFLPRGIEHGYTLQSEDPVRLLVITSPVRKGMKGGWGGLVSDIESGQGELISKPEGANE
jgi:quercetin dioxygenase-like cupin family protein